LQRVGAEVLLHDECSMSAGGEPPEPVEQQLVQGLLADADRRVRPDRGESHLGGDIVRMSDHDVGETVAACVGGAQTPGPGIHVDRPDGRRGGPAGHRQGDRARTAAEIEEVTGCGERECGAQQHRRGRVEVAVGEDAAVGFHREGGVGQCDVDDPGVGRDGGIVVEVLLAGHCL
jgi:hypothetical protein